MRAEDDRSETRYSELMTSLTSGRLFWVIILVFVIALLVLFGALTSS